MFSPAPHPIRVLVVDDDDAFAELITAVLLLDGRAEVVGRAADGAEGVRLARTLQPDVVVMDLRMPRMDGFEATRLIVGGTVRGVRVLVVSSSPDPDDVERALGAGAACFLPKDRAAAELLGAIEQLRPAAATTARASLRLRLARLRPFHAPAQLG